MTLILCTNCGSTISDMAIKCPRCGSLRDNTNRLVSEGGVISNDTNNADSTKRIDTDIKKDNSLTGGASGANNSLNHNTDTRNIVNAVLLCAFIISSLISLIFMIRNR